MAFRQAARALARPRAVQDVNSVYHVNKAHSSYAIIDMLDEIDMLISWNVVDGR